MVVLTMLLFFWYLFLGAGGALPESINLKHRMTIDGPRIMKNVEHWIEFSGGVGESLLERACSISVMMMQRWLRHGKMGRVL